MPLRMVAGVGKLLAVFVMLPALATSARAQVACGVASTGVSFGRYAGNSRVPDDATGSITITCTARAASTLAYSIALLGTQGSALARTMRGAAGGRLAYQLYSDPARTEVWGEGAGGGRAVSFAAAVPARHTNVQHFTVYGRIPAGQNLPPGAYQDEVVVALTY